MCVCVCVCVCVCLIVGKVIARENGVWVLEKGLPGVCGWWTFTMGDAMDGIPPWMASPHGRKTPMDGIPPWTASPHG